MQEQEMQKILDKINEIKKILVYIERIANAGQTLARDLMDRQGVGEGQRSQNIHWRHAKQYLADIKNIMAEIENIK